MSLFSQRISPPLPACGSPHPRPLSPEGRGEEFAARFSVVSMLAVFVAAFVGGGVDDVGEAVAVAVLEVLQVEAVGLADVG